MTYLKSLRNSLFVVTALIIGLSSESSYANPEDTMHSYEKIMALAKEKVHISPVPFPPLSRLDVYTYSKFIQKSQIDYCQLVQHKNPY